MTNTSNREETTRTPNPLKVGDKVYFVTVPWRQELPEMVERTVAQSSQKQIRLNGNGPNLSSVFWIDVNGKPRHGDCDDEPAFYPTRDEAIAAFKRSVDVKREKALAVLASCDKHDAWIGGAS
ncbi:MAG: hypothetical protein MUP97_11820 [Acidimicrobiia bacterium]|nr:hypothetical protein [Acidimicrobiia bacterium]